MGHRTVIGFMWVVTTASEMWGIPTVIAPSENSRLFRLSGFVQHSEHTRVPSFQFRKFSVDVVYFGIERPSPSHTHCFFLSRLAAAFSFFFMMPISCRPFFTMTGYAKNGPATPGEPTGRNGGREVDGRRGGVSGELCRWFGEYN